MQGACHRAGHALCQRGMARRLHACHNVNRLLGAPRTPPAWGQAGPTPVCAWVPQEKGGRMSRGVENLGQPPMSAILLLWVLLQPLRVPGVWAWEIIGAHETQAQCEAARWEQPAPYWTICAEVAE